MHNKNTAIKLPDGWCGNERHRATVAERKVKTLVCALKAILAYDCGCKARDIALDALMEVNMYYDDDGERWPMDDGGVGC